MARDKTHYDKYNRSIKGMFAKLKGRAKEFGRPVTLTLEEFSELRKRPCFFCGWSLPEVGYGVDRLVNEEGYTKKNSVPCCGRCNKAKSNLDREDFRTLIKDIYHYWAKDYLPPDE